MVKKLTGAEVRQSFIDFFVQRGHTFVPSASLVPGGDQTLLFTNAGMVQFKDVFLGADQRQYIRAANSQKCMRVAGKHNDLDDVGRDDSHHTFFEMLGNWSFGDYYKKEAIAWAWELLTKEWGLDAASLWATCFKDEKNEIPADDEAAGFWVQQPGMDASRILSFGRKDNFWEMAETGPCGPCSEIHIDLGEAFCDKKDQAGHRCQVNSDCRRYLELWNLVFIQYNRLTPTLLEPLPATHVDTGMGLERIVAIMQGVYSNYKTDLLSPLMDKVQQLCGDSLEAREKNLTPYRVIADHSRAAAFLIADGVVPGNTGRNYVCRMVVRRAARFGSKIGLSKPFLAQVAEAVIDQYGEAYPELIRNRETIIDNLTREERRFHRTLEAGMSFLEEMLVDLRSSGGSVLDGEKAFELYATHGLPLEISRDIAREQGLDVDESGFHNAMEAHRLVSASGKALGAMGGDDVGVYRSLVDGLISQGRLSGQGVEYHPYGDLKFESVLLGMIREGEPVTEAGEGDAIEVILPCTSFYVEAGGQISDTGTIVSVNDPRWEVEVVDTHKPAAGTIVHVGRVVRGAPRAGDSVIAAVDFQRRRDIMRNHTATHLLHAELQSVLGSHARQAGSLVAPDRLRFDFTHPEALTAEHLEAIEAGVNRAVLEGYKLDIQMRSLNEAIEQGAMALFGEKYAETVRTITIGAAEPLSFELCGGTHVEDTGEVGLFLITSEGSAAAGVRRIEAVTGRKACELVQRRFKMLKQTASYIGCALDEVPGKAWTLVEALERAQKQISRLGQQMVAREFDRHLDDVLRIADVPVLAMVLPNADVEAMRQMTDRFRQRYTSGVVALGSVSEERPTIIVAVTEDLVQGGLHAGELAKSAAQIIGGSGGGRPTLGQAGGKLADKLETAIQQIVPLVAKTLQS